MEAHGIVARHYGVGLGEAGPGEGCEQDEDGELHCWLVRWVGVCGWRVWIRWDGGSCIWRTEL